MNIRTLKLASLTVGMLLLAACTTTFEGSKVDYKSQTAQAPKLELPPDLSQVTQDSKASAPVNGALNASTLQGRANSLVASTVAANQLADVKVQREGSQRWLVVDRPPEKLWDEVKTFWIDHGFALAIDQPSIGVLETEWAENRAKLPKDWVRKTFGRVLESLYDTSQRDKFRTRMERTASGGTEIYISHKGMAEDFTTAAKDTLKWKNRPVDPELEVEFLKRLMMKLGATSENAKKEFPEGSVTGVAQARARFFQDGTQFSLIVNDPFEQAWRRVGLSLDRTNFTVEDRDRSKGIYFVRYVEPDAEKNAPGFFARLFGAKTKDSLQKYQIVVSSELQQTRVRVASDQGQLVYNQDAQNILKVLETDLK